MHIKKNFVVPLCSLLGLMLAIPILQDDFRIEAGPNIACASPDFLNSVQRSKFYRSASDMLMIAKALSTYRTNFSGYPIAEESSLEHLLPIDSYNGPSRDAWGHAYLYSSDAEGGEYTLISYGSDKKAGEGPEKFSADLHMFNGVFLAPEWLITPCRNQQQSEAGLYALGTALGSYQVDYNHFPISTSLSPFRDGMFPPAYYSASYKDGWGGGVWYISAPNGESYSMYSYGKDRQPGSGAEFFDADTLFSNGALHAPVELQDTCPVDPCEKVTRSESALRVLGTALGSYQVDYNHFPIRTSLSPFEDGLLPPGYVYYYSSHTGLYKDGWGEPIWYISGSRGDSYSLYSYGKDRQPGRGTDVFGSDILFANGALHAPAELREACPLEPAAAQKRTIADMRALGTALGSYQVDYNVLPIFPNETGISEAVVPRVYYEGRYEDAWGTTIRYLSDSEGESYTLTSYGKNRLPGSGDDEFDEDILFSNGALITPY